MGVLRSTDVGSLREGLLGKASRWLPLAVSLSLLVGYAMSATPAEAASGFSATGTFSQIPDLYRTAVADVGKNLASYARNLMATLALVEIVWTFGKIVVSGADLGELLYALMTRILIVGAFVWLTNVLPQYGGMNGFVTDFASRLYEVSSGANTGPIDPGSVLQIAFSSGLQLVKSSSWVNAVAAVIILAMDVIVGAVVAGFMVLAYVEVHILFAAGIISLGFAPWGETRVLARNFLFAAIGKSLKLFGVLLVGTVTVNVLQKLGNTVTCATCGTGAAINASLLTLAVLVVGAMIIAIVPAALEHMVMSGPGGQSSMSGLASFAGGVAASRLTKTSEKAAEGGGLGGGGGGAPSRAQRGAAAAAVNEKLSGMNGG